MSTDIIPLVIDRIEAAPSLQGRTFRGSWFSIERGKIALFEAATYTTENSYIVDEDAYPDDIIEGFHLLALLDHLSNEVIAVDSPTWMAWNYGLNKVRFVTPVAAETPIRLTGTVSDVSPRGAGYLMQFDFVVELQGTDRPAFTAQSLALWLDGGPHERAEE